MQVYLIDGTYELFRQYYGRPDRSGPAGRQSGAALGVASSLAGLLEGGVTHIGVATDHVITSFRNALWPGYKDGTGVPPELLAQFPLLEEVLESLGIVVWPMIELEADDALASVAAIACDDARVEQVVICTPDKDLAQCVRDQRVVQLDRRSGRISDDAEIRSRFGVYPQSIPDWLALVGDAADGFPGIAGWGKRSASIVLEHYEHLEAIPSRASDWDAAVVAAVRGADRLAAALDVGRDLAFLFRDLATLRIDESLVTSVEELEWRGPADNFTDLCARLGALGLADRVAALRR